MKAKKLSTSTWTELLKGKEDFQQILLLLSEFDEKTGRHRRFGNPETHYMRRALAIADADSLRIFLRALGGFTYHIAAQYSAPSGLVVTSWIHEDGIRVERDELRDEREHPVHSIRCLTDFFEAECTRLVEDPDALHINDYTAALLSDDMLQDGCADLHGCKSEEYGIN